MIRKEGFSVLHISYIFCTDAYLIGLNQKYLRHDTYTDILTFQLSPQNEPILSDIYISIDRVRDNARLLGQGFSKELHRVIFHGALHLCGYKDKTRKQISQIRHKEDEYLRQYLFHGKLFH